MAGQVRISPDAMRGRATEYRTEAGHVDDVIRKMDGLLSALQGEWEGESSRGYSERYNQLRPSFVNAKELIDEIAKALDTTAQIMEETDQNIGAQFRG